MSIYICLILCVVVTEAIVELLCKSRLFLPLRNFIDNITSKDSWFCKNIVGFINKIISCGYCTSVWVSSVITPLVIFFSEGYEITNIKNWLLVIMLVIFVHRVSNYLHMFIDKWVDKFYSNKESVVILREDKTTDGEVGGYNE